MKKVLFAIAIMFTMSFATLGTSNHNDMAVQAEKGELFSISTNFP